MAILKTEKALEKFESKLQAIFNKYGVVKSNDFSYPYELSTDIGTLLIHPRNEADRTSGWWIFTRFENGWDKDMFLEKVGKHSGVNEHSGKWNVLGHKSENALEMIEWQLKSITKLSKEAA